MHKTWIYAVKLFIDISNLPAVDICDAYWCILTNNHSVIQLFGDTLDEWHSVAVQDPGHRVLSSPDKLSGWLSARNETRIYSKPGSKTRAWEIRPKPGII